MLTEKADAEDVPQFLVIDLEHSSSTKKHLENFDYERTTDLSSWR